VAKFDI